MPSYITKPYLARHRRGELALLSTRARDAGRTLVVA